MDGLDIPDKSGAWGSKPQSEDTNGAKALTCFAG